MSVRVRFAPSPTGPLHIGGVRTALYNYLFAKANDGTFILRIEDTDRARFVAEAEQYIINTLNWLGLQPDEGPVTGGDFGPYRQSERKSIYSAHIQQLLDNGWAYYAFDTPEELDQMRERKASEGIHSPKYDATVRMEMRNSLTLSPEEVTRLLADGVDYTVRLKVPENEVVRFEDEVRGEVAFNSQELDDKVLVKADGMPTYHFANVVDDRQMRITHVIRGEEWLSSTGHHVLLYRAFGWEGEMPAFAHLPLILKPTGKGKLSKRDGAKFGFPVFPMLWKDAEEDYPGFRDMGFLPEAVINFLALLGWNPGTEQELFSLGELVEAFGLDRVAKAGARFDFDKARWFNSQYIAAKGEDLLPVVREMGVNGEIDSGWLGKLIALYAERASVLTDFPGFVSQYTEQVSEYDPKIVRKKWDDAMSGHLDHLAGAIDQGQPETADDFAGIIKPYIQGNGLKFGDVLQLMRTCVSGSPQGPDVFEMLALMGAEQVASRIRTANTRFAEMKSTDDA